MNTKDFYNNNVLVLTKQEIFAIEDTYKNLIKKSLIWEDFVTLNQDPFRKAPLIKQYCERQKENEKGLQGGKIFELVVLLTLAKIFGADSIQEDRCWSDQIEITLTAEQGKGSGQTRDILIHEKLTGNMYIGEIKDEIARCGECDLKYDEDGHLYPAKLAKNWSPEWQPILDAFNADTSMFELFGHNYKIDGFDNACEQVVNFYTKNIDFIFTSLEDKLIAIPAQQVRLNDIFSFKGSEIRSSGKNPVIPFTPKYLYNSIKHSQFFISETQEEYLMHSEVLIEKNGRGGALTTRYGFLPGFIVKKEGVTSLPDNVVAIKKHSIKQLNANISIHIRLNGSYQEIKQICIGEKI